MSRSPTSRRANSRLHTAWAVLAAMLLCAAGSPYTGRSIAEVLAQLQATGVNVIFSDELVLPEMRVVDEPTGSSARELIESMLAPHGLGIREDFTGVFSIVRVSRAPGTISGIVRQRGEGPVLAGVEIVLVGTDHLTRSNAGGRFELTGLAPGAYAVELRHPDFVVERLDRVEVRPESSIELSLTLVPSPRVHAEVVVTPSHYSLLRDQPESNHSLSRAEIEALPHLGEDPLRAVAWLPGTATTDISAELNIRGGEENETLFLLDGLEIYQPFYFRDIGIFSSIDAEVVDAVEFMSGAYPVEYGDRMSGVVDLTTASPTRPFGLALGLSLLHYRLRGSGTFDDEHGEWLLSGRRGFLKYFLSLANSGDEPQPTSPAYVDLTGKLRYTLGSRSVAALNVFRAADDFDEDDGDKLEVRHENTYAWVNLLTSWAAKVHSETQVSAGRLERYREQLDFVVGPPTSVLDERRLDSFGLKQDWAYELSEQHSLKWGFDVRRLEAHYDYASSNFINFPFLGAFLIPEDAVPVTREVALAPRGRDLAAYFADRMHLGGALAVELGVRWDDQSYTGGEAQLSPRLNVSYFLSPRSSLRLGWGIFHQSQGLHELQVGDGVDHYWPAQQSEHRVLGWQHRFASAEGLELRVEAYQKDISKVRPRFENIFDPAEFISEVEPDRLAIVPDRARAEGLELFLKQYRSDGFGWWLSYALARAEDRIDDEWVPRAWDQRHTARASLNYRIRDLWSLTLAGQYHTGWPTTHVEARIDWDAENQELHIFPVLGRRNAERLPDYFRLDLRVSRHLSLGKFGDFEVFVDVINVLNRENVCCSNGVPHLRFRFDGSGIADVELERAWVPRLPTFGISWKF